MPFFLFSERALRRIMTIPEAWADVVPKDDIRLLDTGRQQEVEQPLIDLGYLQGQADSRLVVAAFQQNLVQAIRTFRLEYLSIGMLGRSIAHLAKAEASELDSLELNLLHHLTSLDGEVLLERLPQTNQCDLWSRILHYRLVVLGLFDLPVSTPFGKHSLLALRQLANWLGQNSLLTIANLAGDIPQLTAQLLQTGILKKNVVAFRYQAETLEEDLLMEVAEEPGESDNEAALIRAEKSVEKELAAIDEELINKESAEWERLEKRNKNKKRRIEKVEARIEQTLSKTNTILQKSLQQEKELQDSILVLQNKIDQLHIDQASDKQQLEKQKQKVVQLNKNALKQKKKKEKQLAKLKKSVGHLPGLPHLLVQLTLLAQDNRHWNSELNQLENVGARKKKLRQLRKIIIRNEKDIRRLQQSIQRQKEMQILEADLQSLRSDTNDLQSEKHNLKHLQQRFSSTNHHLQVAKKQLNQQNKLFQKLQLDRQQKISSKQLKILHLKTRLDKLLEKVNGLRFRFKAQLKRSLDRDFYNELKQKVFRKNDTHFLTQIAVTPFNLFLIRLIQIRQWMNGYYYGRLDSLPADRTFESIVEFTEEEQLRRLRLKYVLTKLGNEQSGFWLLNAQYYFECLVELDAQSGPENTPQLIELYESQFGDNLVYKNEATTRAWKEYTAEIEEGMQGSEHFIRRFYYGVRSLVRTIGRVLKKIIRFIIRGVKTLIRIFKNFIKLLYKEIREGVKNFFDGMDFLFGKRMIETVALSGQRIVTKYDFDFDSMVILPYDTPSDAVQRHIQLCLMRTSNVHFSMKLCGRIIKWAYEIVTSVFSWPMLCVRIAFFFKDLIIDYIKKQKRQKKLKMAK